MLETKIKGRNWKPGLFVLGLAVLLALAGCKGTTSTTTTDTTGTVARILITNTYGQSLDIFMDSVFQMTVANGATATITNVALQTHSMEAKIAGTGNIIDTTSIDVTATTDYTYAIDRPDINVTNGFGETLKVYMDDVYRFDLVDDENRWLINVTLASHFLKATRLDGTEVASITLNVAQNKDYAWTIQ